MDQCFVFSVYTELVRSLLRHETYLLSPKKGENYKKGREADSATGATPGLCLVRLTRGVLVYAEHGRVRRRMQIQANHIGRLGREVRIAGGLVAVQPMGLQGVISSDARHRHVQEPPNYAASMHKDQGVDPSLGVSVVVQAACLDPIGYFVECAPGGAGEQSRQLIRGNALAPPTAITVSAVQLGANLGPRQANGLQQNQFDRFWLSHGAEVTCVHSWSVSSPPP